ncbi:hypothetical protein BgiBS90_020601 [Biomphalaria glabrata]|nr:hypothetical protein BgiBS90_020601 [Biomphalaria glabrata]
MSNYFISKNLQKLCQQNCYSISQHAATAANLDAVFDDHASCNAAVCPGLLRLRPRLLLISRLLGVYEKSLPRHRGASWEFLWML